MGLLNLLFGGGQTPNPMQGSAGYGQDLFGNPAVTSGAALSGGFDAQPSRPPDLYAGQSLGQKLIGGLGDAFLIQAGKDPYYRQQLMEQAQQAALGPDFASNPQAAAERIAQAPGGLAGGLDLWKNAQTLDTQRANLQSEMAARKATMEAAQTKLYSGIVGSVKNDATYQAMLPMLTSKAQALGLPPPPAKYDPDWVENNANIGVDRYRQIRADQMERGLGIQQENADTRKTQGNARVQQGQDKIDQTSPNDVLGGIYQKIAAGQRISPLEQRLYNDHLRSGLAASANSRTNEQNANTRGRQVDSKLTPPPEDHPPRYAGDRILGPGGVLWTSPDGKNWTTKK